MASSPDKPVLVLGGSGMLGYAIAASLNERGWPVRATIRGARWSGRFARPADLVCNVDAIDFDSIEAALAGASPAMVVNCIAMRSAEGYAAARQMYRVNSRFPHRLAALCAKHRCRLVHFSTDGVFDGASGGYCEDDAITPQGIYARSKALGEIVDQPGVLTIRTSMIGLSPGGEPALADWLLQRGNAPVKGYHRAIFSGLPVTEIAEFLCSRVLTRDSTATGLFHLAADPIDKFTLLKLVRAAWGFDAETIRRDASVHYDRSLISRRSDVLAGYRAPPWPDLIRSMHSFYGAPGRNAQAPASFANDGNCAKGR